jgi:hypothetical protein
MARQRRRWPAASVLSFSAVHLAAAAVQREHLALAAVKTELTASGKTCADARSCTACSLLPECGWCAESQVCVGGNKLGPFNTQCRFYDFSDCRHVPCEARGSCGDCLKDLECGWCAADATCSGGGVSGPFDKTACQAPLWFHSQKEQATCLPDAGPTLQPQRLWSKLRGMMYRTRGSALSNEEVVDPTAALRKANKKLQGEKAELQAELDRLRNMPPPKPPPCPTKEVSIPLPPNPATQLAPSTEVVVPPPPNPGMLDAPPPVPPPEPVPAPERKVDRRSRHDRR